MKKPPQILCLALSVIYAVASSGCISYRPRPITEVPFIERAQEKSHGDVHVTVAVLDDKESKRVFGVPLYNHRIQPVWLKIENHDTDPYVFLKRSLDPNYYSAMEAAYMSHFTTYKWLAAYGIVAILILPAIVPGLTEFISAKYANKKMNAYFQNKEIGNDIIAPGKSVSGFVFTTLDRGTKEVRVVLYGPEEDKKFDFFISVPGIKADYMKRKFDELYPKKDIVSYDEKGFREALQKIPRCTTNKKGMKEGDPLNLVVVGELEDIIYAFTIARWDETESLCLRSAWWTAKAFFTGMIYRLSPVSPLYVFGRSQDVAFQKIRRTINQRHHLRLWYTPMQFEGKPVWIGQASRDIGVRFTLKTWNLTTHKIDPDVDDERDYIIGDILETKRLSGVGFVEGVGAAPKSKPRRNLTGDQYFTDGLRGVLMISEKPVKPHFFDWDLGQQWEE